MQEFKFACPVCGQHITAAASASGAALECPTCFRRIIVPQAPTTGDSKLILSAIQADKPRPAAESHAGAGRGGRGFGLGTLVRGLLLVGLVGGVAWAISQWGGKAYQWARSRVAADRKGGKGLSSEPHVYPVPTNVFWSIQSTNPVIPGSVAVGRIHGRGFQCEHATLQGGSLTLRQGKSWPPDLGLTIRLYAQQAQDLSGKTVFIGPERIPPLPKVVLRWKAEQGGSRTKTYDSGYLLKAVFGKPANGRMPGQLYIALPDEEKSFVAGQFDAEIRPTRPRKPHPAKPAPAAASTNQG